MMTRAMHRRPPAAVLGARFAILVILMTLPMIASSPAGAAPSSKPKEIVVVGSRIAPSGGLLWRGRHTVNDVTMKRGFIGIRNHPDLLWQPTY
jgi:hypothetical protein